MPMLPEKLSNGLCSLNRKWTSLAMVCDMFVTQEGDVSCPVLSCRYVGHADSHYTEVAAVLGNTRGPEAQRPRNVSMDLLNLHGVYQARTASRQRRGCGEL